jgi:predicted ATP-dependent protease
MKNKSELIKIKKGECYTHEQFKISLIEASCKWTVDGDSALTVHLLLEKK